ncbi:MAG TPA: DUF192 domain-containing protein [Stellaceae bacterium]|nr:DUF192 domain-containing protein [Stellaceae bacterium]
MTRLAPLHALCRFALISLKTIGLMVLAPAALTVAASVSAHADLLSFSHGDVYIDTVKGPRHFTVEVAQTEPQREQGLMFRQSLPANAGMLFLYGQPQQAAFWMKNTFIPLDMLFIGADGHIVNIAKRAVPMSQATIYSSGPVQAILEINGGTADKLGIKPGDMVRVQLAQ